MCVCVYNMYCAIVNDNVLSEYTYYSYIMVNYIYIIYSIISMLTFLYVIESHTNTPTVMHIHI